MQRHDHHHYPSIHSQPFDSCSIARKHLETKLFPAVLWQPFQNWQKPRVTVAHRPPMTPRRTCRGVGICQGVFTCSILNTPLWMTFRMWTKSRQYARFNYRLNVPSMSNQWWKLCSLWSKIFQDRIVLEMFVPNAQMFFAISFEQQDLIVFVCSRGFVSCNFHNTNVFQSLIVLTTDPTISENVPNIFWVSPFQFRGLPMLQILEI